MDVRWIVPRGWLGVSEGGRRRRALLGFSCALVAFGLLTSDAVRSVWMAPGPSAAEVTPGPHGARVPVSVSARPAPPSAPLPPVEPPAAIVAPVVERPRRSPWDEPTASAWPVVERWSDRMEREYSAFVERLGRAVYERRCTRLPQCLRDPRANSLYDPVTDGRMALEVDCADLPYVLRAYYAFKRRLPFGFVSAVRGRGHDARYMLRVTPVQWKTWRDFRTPRTTLRALVTAVHSGMYRVRPALESGDFYTAAVTRRAIIPGAVYYDPNGHVLSVAEVRSDGTVHLIDGHPDGSITWRRFGQGYAAGSRRLGGGFLRFRPLELQARGLTRVPNRRLPDADPVSQYDPSRWTVDGHPVGYHAWVRASLAQAGAVPDPVQDFREQVRALCRDVTDRTEAVDAALAAGLHQRPHPGTLPWNIYGTTGDWETFSTPSRDARFRASLRELYQGVAALPSGSPLRATLQGVWREELARSECSFRYTNSAGAPVSFTFETVLDRLFALSFDPAHCPELRWGAPEGSQELSTCPDDGIKRGWYLAEQRLRNQVDRAYGVPTPLAWGPGESPDLDVRRPLGLR